MVILKLDFILINTLFGNWGSPVISKSFFLLILTLFVKRDNSFVPCEVSFLIVFGLDFVRQISFFSVGPHPNIFQGTRVCQCTLSQYLWLTTIDGDKNTKKADIHKIVFWFCPHFRFSDFYAQARAFAQNCYYWLFTALFLFSHGDIREIYQFLLLLNQKQWCARAWYLCVDSVQSHTDP